jgi:hypothetical protein
MEIGIAILMVFNVFMWSQVYQERMAQIVHTIKKEREAFLNNAYNAAVETHNLLMAKHIARITKKRFVLA